MRSTTRRGIAVSAGLVSLALFGASVSAHADTVELTPGSAAATADVLGLNIPYGGANLGIGFGTANASYFEQNAKASAISVDPGFLRLSSIVGTCNSGFPIKLPEPTRADTNASGGKPQSNTRNGSTSGFGARTETAAVSTGSYALGELTSVSGGLADLVKGTGGLARTEVRLNQKERSRTSHAIADSGTITLLGGLVQIRGMRWEITQKAVGADSRSHTVTNEHSFTIGSAMLGGQKLATGSPEQMAKAVELINKTTGRFGLRLRLPALVRNGATGLELTPMTIAIGGDTLYGPALYPLLAGPQRTSVINLFNKITNPLVFDAATCKELFGAFEPYPQLNAGWNSIGVIAPIVLSAAAASINGGAELDVEIGGVRSTFDDTYYPPRVSTQRPSLPLPVVETIVTPGSKTTRSAPQIVAIESVRTTSSCRSTSAAGRASCWKGLAPLAAVLAAGVCAALIATDEVVRRRRTAREAA